jgi:hypothetical protein
MQKGINIRIITPEETLHTRIGKLIARENGRNENDERELVGVRKQGKFEIHLFDTLQQKRLQTNISFLIVDSKVSLVEELKDYNSSSNGELSLVTYSNSDLTVFTYVSIFETLWAQTE